MDSAKNLSTSFTAMRNVAMISLLAMVLVAVSSGFLLKRAYDKSGRLVYVVTPTGTAAAQAAEMGTYSEAEARNMVKVFMKTMFGHDQYTFQENLEAALPLIEQRGGRRIYEGFTRGQVLQNYQRYAARNEVSIDSVVVDMKRKPWTGRAYIKQRISIGGQLKEPLPLAAKFNLEETQYRSDSNPYGLLITNFDYIPYNPPLSREEKELLIQQEADRQRHLEEAQTQGVAPGTNPAPAPTPR